MYDYGTARRWHDDGAAVCVETSVVEIKKIPSLHASNRVIRDDFQRRKKLFRPFVKLNPAQSIIS
jgi:hypothetical protein